MWKFPKGINARDLKARLAESKQAETLGLPGEVLPAERISAISSMSSERPPQSGRGPLPNLRQSLLVPGKESPRWLSLQQVRLLSLYNSSRVCMHFLSSCRATQRYTESPQERHLK